MLTNAPTGRMRTAGPFFRVRVMSVICGKPARALSRLGPRTGMRLRALIGELGRIEVPALHGANRSRHIAVTGVDDALQETGNLLEERISVLHRQRPGCGEDSPR
jgi:hypothetical protein